MNSHFITLFDAIHLRTTVILFTVSFLLISGALAIGITDNLPAIAMLFAGIIFLFFSVLHPWKKVVYYATFVAVCGIILPLVFGNQTLGEDIDFAFGGICAAGIVTGIIGISIRIIVDIRINRGK
jgi:hypothetical protein